MKLDEIKARLKETEHKSSAPGEFEEAIAEAFKFLGLEAQLIGGSGDTDVLLTANIGNESYTVSVDGKTSKQDRITDNQIDWLSLRDHRKKNQARFVVVVGSAFAGGNLASRAQEHNVALLKTEDLIRLMQAHAAFPITLLELKELFSGYDETASRVEDLITQTSARRNLIKQFKTVVEEMHAVQDGKLGYFTLQSLVAREKIEGIDIEPEQIESIIHLLQLPFIDGIDSLSDNQYLMTIETADLANIFFQISQILLKEENEDVAPPIEKPSVEKPAPEIATKYFEWTIGKGATGKDTVIATARKENPYLHYCPIDHFRTLVKTILSTFEEQNLVNKDTIYSRLEGRELASGRSFKGRPEEYKIYVAFGVLELEGLIKSTGSKRPVEYTLNVPPKDVRQWCKDKLPRNETFQRLT